MKRAWTLLLAVIVLGSLFCFTANAETANAAPTVIPAIREWVGGEGSFHLDDTVTINKKAAVISDGKLSIISDSFLNYLGVQVTFSDNEGDIFLVTDNSDAQLGKDGYSMEITEKAVSIKAPEDIGLLYGIYTVLQSVKVDGFVPCGSARDYSYYQIRSCMLDVARAWVPLEYVEEITKYMAFFKLNEFHLHINDAGRNNYSAFRLESNVPGLTSKDGHYTKDAYRAYQKRMLEYGVEIITEIDTPAHSRCFNGVVPKAYMLNTSHLDITNPDVLAFVKDLFDEYITGEDPVFVSKRVHIGTDEYPDGYDEEMLAYTDALIDHMNSRGYTPRFWGGFGNSGFNGTTPVSSNAQVNFWTAGSSDYKLLLEMGFDIVNSTSSKLYIVPGGNAGFADYLDLSELYSSWNINYMGADSGKAIDPNHPQLLGGCLPLWNDLYTQYSGFSIYDIFDRFRGGICFMAEKTWCGEQTRQILGADFVDRYDTLSAYAPQADPGRHHVDNISGTVPAGVKAFGWPYVASVDVTVNSLGEGFTIFGGEAGQLYVADDGTVGFRRGVYDFVYPYKLPAGKTTKLTLNAGNKFTSLTVNGGTVYQPTNTNNTDLTYSSTFVLPLETIGEGLDGVVENLSVEKLSALEAALKNARAAMVGVVGADRSADCVIAGTKFAPTARLNALQSAVEQGEAILTNPSAANYAAIVSLIEEETGLLQAAVQIGTMPLGTHSHCVCTGVRAHTHEVEVWEPWGDDEVERTTLPTAAGNYYLVDMVVITKEYSLGANDPSAIVNLCLNGFDVTSVGDNVRIYNVYSTLSICDCSQEEKWGSLIGNDADHGVIQVRDNNADHGVMNLYSGILTVHNGVECTYSGLIRLGNSNTNGATFNMYGGMLCGGSGKEGGAVTSLSKSEFNMYGGTITGNRGDIGGNFYMKGKLNIYGGSLGAVNNLSGGQVAGIYSSSATTISGNIDAGSLDISAGGSLVLKNFGGNISFYAASESTWATGDAKVLIVDKNGKATVVGPGTTTVTATDSNNRVSSYQVTVSCDTSALEVALADAKAAVEGVQGSDRTADRVIAGIKFVPTAKLEALQTAIDQGEAVMQAPTVSAVNPAFDALDRALAQFKSALQTGTMDISNHSHCVCTNVLDHTHNSLTWEPWGDQVEELTSLPTSAGNYFLVADIEVAIKDGKSIGSNNVDLELNLCLNGFRMENTVARVYNVYCKLNVCDCSAEENWGSMLGAATGTGVTIQLRNNKSGKPVMNLYSGIIAAGVKTTYDRGGIIRVGNSTANLGVFNMYGGKLCGGRALYGGAIYSNNNTKVNLYGGTISDCQADIGEIFYTEGEVNISGGVVEGRTAADASETISVVNTGKLNISGGTFTAGLSVEGTTVKAALAENRIVVKTKNYATVDLSDDAVSTGKESVTVIPAPAVNEDLIFASASVILHSNLGVNFKVDNATMAGYTEPFVVFSFGGVDIIDKDYVVDSGKHVFRFRDIAPHRLGDTITATVYAYKDGLLCQGQTVQYSVKQYCYNMLGTYNDVDYSGAAYGELRSLLVDLLNYGAAAQEYTNYNTDALVNGELAGKQLDWATQAIPEVESILDLQYATVEAPTVTWVSGGLRLDDSVTVRYTLATDSLEGLTIKVKTADCEYVFESSELVATETAGQYYLYFSKLNAAQMREPILATAYVNDTAVSNTVRYSIESYAKDKAGSGNALGELLIAMMRYGDSALAYVK